MILRSPVNYDRASISRKTGLACRDKTRTQQHQGEETDINVIVKRFGVTGMLPQRVPRPTVDGFADVFDFQTALNAVVAAQRSFDMMPADVRERFNNDPAKFVDFCSDEKNLPELRRLGLADPEPKPDPADLKPKDPPKE